MTLWFINLNISFSLSNTHQLNIIFQLFYDFHNNLFNEERFITKFVW